MKNIILLKLLYLVPTATIILLTVYSFISYNIIYCAEVDNTAFGELNDFMVRGHITRATILRDITEFIEDVDALLYILSQLRDVYDYGSPFEEDDPFSDPSSQIKVINQHHFSFRGLLIFIFLSLFGLFWFKFPFIMSPMLYYRREIGLVLSMMEGRPDLYLELLADFYEHLVELEILPKEVMDY